MRYICFDVETPNLRNERMSSIGICTVEGGVIVDEFYTLINPEQHFDDFNIRLTHITPEAAEAAPIFRDVWTKISPIMQSGLLCAHNAQFDMSVLSKCLRAYGFPTRDTRYLCTCRMSQKIFPDIENHRLDTVCRELSVPLDRHHNALSDAKACAGILIKCINSGADISGFVRPYSLKYSKTVRAH